MTIYMAAIIGLIVLDIESCIEEKETDISKKRALEDDVVKYIKPGVMNPYDNRCIINKSELMFEQMMAMMQENWNVDTREMTEFEFFSKIKYLSNKHQQSNLKNGDKQV